MPPDAVSIVEVGPRDGLQNEAEILPTGIKAAFVEALAAAGLRQIEVTSFVHPGLVPQLADAEDLVRALSVPADTVLSALVPNREGLDRAVRSGIPRIAFFTAASDTFTERNIRMSVASSLDACGDICAHAQDHGVSVRGYISTAFSCPFEGATDPTRVASIAEAMARAGIDEIAISDTTGSAEPEDILRTVSAVMEVCPVERVALHLHDTHGHALANVDAGLDLGVRTFDAAAGGLGGCPFAPGSPGNLATEDLVDFLDRRGISCGVNLHGVAAASSIVEEAIGRQLPGRIFRTLHSSHGGADTP